MYVHYDEIKDEVAPYELAERVAEARRNGWIAGRYGFGNISRWSFNEAVNAAYFEGRDKGRQERERRMAQ